MPPTFNTGVTVRTTGAMQKPLKRVRNGTTEKYSISLLALMRTASSEMLVFASEGRRQMHSLLLFQSYPATCSIICSVCKVKL